MTEYRPQITAYRGDDGEEWRLLRLDNAWEYIKKNQPFLCKRITHMHDHKGQMTIRILADDIEDKQFETFVNDIEAAWNSQNEHEIDIEIVFKEDDVLH